ncbi:MAG: hypothetical protein KGH69_04300 [Candidatus Micrarchaeota archaeon]|nr:hypothetical protein [Candidatus Micrarchaeota archaeon]
MDMANIKNKALPVAAAIAISMSGSPAIASSKQLLRGRDAQQYQLAMRSDDRTHSQPSVRPAKEAKVSGAGEETSSRGQSDAIGAIFDQMSSTAKTALKIATGISAAIGVTATALYWKRRITKEHIRSRLSTIFGARSDGDTINWQKIYAQGSIHENGGNDDNTMASKARLGRNTLNAKAARESDRREQLFRDATSKDKAVATDSDGKTIQS